MEASDILVLEKELARWLNWKNEGDMWQLPTGVWHHESLLDFTKSLDACFKHLVPKIDFGDLEFILLGNGQWMVTLDYVGESDGRYFESAETPSLALCLTIKVLIENEDTKVEE